MPDRTPKGWVKTTLGEIRRDESFGISQQQMRGEIFELYSVPAFSEGKPYVIPGEEIGSNKIVVSPGDVLLCKINPRINRAWVVGDYYPNRKIASTEWIVFSKQDGISSDFLRYFFTQDTFKNYLATNVSGVGGSLMRVRPAIVEKHLFPLPPTREQERIVAKLDASLSRVAAGETAARRAQARLKRYRAAVLHAAVTGELTRDWRKTHKPDESGAQLLKRLLRERRGRWEEAELQRLHAAGKRPKDDKWKKRYPEPVTANTTNLPVLPKSWVWASIDQLTVLVTSGSRGWKSYYSKDGAIFIRSQDVRTDELDLTDVAHVRPPKNSEGMRTQVRQYDLLVTITGANVGKAALVRPKLPEAYVSQHVGLVRLVDTKSGRLIHLNITAPTDGRKRLLGSAYGAGKPGLNLENLRELAIALPPLAEQVEIVRDAERRLAAADRLAATLNRQLDRARATRQSLLREAFAGKLVLQTPADEPASVLLGRIRATREAEAEMRKKKPKSRRGARRHRDRSVAMNQNVPTSEGLLVAWQKIRKKPDAQRLFQAAGYMPGQVVEFYEMLRATPEVRESFEAASKASSRERKRTRTAVRDEDKSKGHFRLGTLWLENFKNLKNYGVSFNPSQGLDVILGWNGTGKSNLFEALVIIFRDLHYWWEKNRWPAEAPAAYRIAYEIEEQFVEVTWTPSKMKRPELRRALVPKRKGANLKFEEIKREELPLPRFVFGYYSGPTNRLAEHFLPMKRDHYERLRKASSDDPKTLATLLKQRRFFCAETHHAKYVLLAFAYKEDRKINEFLENRLRIVGFESALFIIRRPEWGQRGTPKDFWGATGIMLRVMEKLRRFAIAPMVVKQTVSDGYRTKREDHYYFYLPNLKSLHAFAAEYADARSFFLALESTDFSELIYDVKIQVRIKAAPDEKVSITFRELSEGEQQLLIVLGLMRFTKSHQSLVLLDEPDTHLNPHWSVDFLKDLASVTSDDDKPSPEQQTSQLLMATHDPLVIASLFKEQVHLLKRDQQTLRCYWQQASVNPRGLGFTGILTSEMFGFRSDLDPETLADLDNRVRLIAKEDELSPNEKKHLEEIDKRLTEAGFSKAFSDPYYAAFVRAWGRRYADQMAGAQFLNNEEREEIDRIAKEVLKEAVKEVEADIAS